MTRATCLLLAAAVSAGFFGSLASAQHVPAARGSLDAMTVVPAPGSELRTQPAGHPQVGAPAAAPGTDPSAVVGHPMKVQHATGAIRILFKQGTRDGTPLAKDPVRVELFAKGEPIKTFHSTVGELGVVEIDKLPLDVPFQAVTTVTHAGVEQQLVGPPQHRYQPAVEFEMPVYEITSEKPAWTIGLRHIQVEILKVETPGQPESLVLQVTEMVGGFNPSDRAWTGEVVNGEMQTVAIALSSNVSSVQLGAGFAEARAKVVNNTLIRSKAMLPGSNRYVFGYQVPVVDGKASLSFNTPVDTTLFAVYLPGEIKIEQATGLEAGASGGTHADEKRQLLKAKSVTPGQVLTVQLSNIQPPKPVLKDNPALTDQSTDLNLPKPGQTPKTPAR
jgi:hypothetical protein